MDWLVHPIIKASSSLTLTLNRPQETHSPKGSMMDDKANLLGDRILGQKCFELIVRETWEVCYILLYFTVSKLRLREVL